MRNYIQKTAPFWVSCLLLISSPLLHAQNGTQKPVQALEKVNQKTQQGVAMTSQMAGQTTQIVANIQQAYDNVKGIVKVFEPILKFRIKKKSAATQEGQPPVDQAEQQQTTTYEDAPPSYDNSNYDQGTTYPPATDPYAQPEYDYNSTSSNVTYNDIIQGVPLETESPAYNTDGTANLGSQNHTQYGCYLDILKGAVMDEIDAAGNSMSVDLIFTATDYYGSAPMYALLTPSYVKNDFFSNYYFRGAKYKDANIPPKQWENVIESEVALTSLTGAQFDKFQTNDQLTAVVKQCSGFKDKFESRTKLDGKVFAIKTEIDSRTAYALVYVVTHYGTTGANGYLKIKLKVTGYDANGDGNPDANLYNTQY